MAVARYRRVTAVPSAPPVIAHPPFTLLVTSPAVLQAGAGAGARAGVVVVVVAAGGAHSRAGQGCQLQCIWEHRLQGYGGGLDASARRGSRVRCLGLHRHEPPHMGGGGGLMPPIAVPVVPPH